MLRSRRDLRLASGLVLFSYVSLHLLCHALGLVSVDTAERALRTTLLLWHSLPGTALLYGAAAVHVGLALLAIYDRRSLRMSPLQALRILLGLTMPILLIGHFVGTRYAFEHFGLSPDYRRVVANLWAADGQGRQLALLAPGWLHGCLGLRYAFGHRRRWRQLQPVLAGAALLLPVLAGLGFLVMGRAIDGAEPGSAAAQLAMTAAQAQALGRMREVVLAAYAGLILLVAVARIVRGLNEHRRRITVRIAYPQRAVSVPRGWTVLEASRSHGIPHQSGCGGRARCSTCRVRVVDGLAHCPPPGPDELRTLERIAAPDGVRLACQLRPGGPIAVRPLLAAEQRWWHDAPPPRPTIDREVAVLFCHWRALHGAASGAPSPHDALHAQQQLDAIVRAALLAEDGLRCREGGEHWMALFGAEGGAPAAACGQAWRAALRIEAGVRALLARLQRELGLQTVFSIGLHAGPAVVLPPAAGSERIVAAGAALGVAEVLQHEATRRSAACVVSQAVVAAAGIDSAGFEWFDATDAGAPASPVPVVFATPASLPRAAVSAAQRA